MLQRHGDPSKLDAGLKNGMPREMSRDGLEHVELAMLDRVSGCP